jgi:hypothetical protein
LKGISEAWGLQRARKQRVIKILDIMKYPI